MCGRYYVDKDTFEEACRLAGCSGFAGGDGFVGGDGFSGCGSFTASDGGTAGDIVPSGTAWVLRGDQGYPGAEPRYPGTEPEPCRPGTGPCIRAERMACRASNAVMFLGLVLLCQGRLLGNLEHTLIAVVIVFSLAFALQIFLREYLLCRYDREDPAEEE